MPPSTRGPGWLMMAAVLDEAACTKARAALMVPATPEARPGVAGALQVPDWHMTVEDLIAGGDKTVARVSVTGTHKGEFMGVPPAGTRVDVQLIDIMRFDGAGLVCEHWGVADMLSLMQQLGVVPAGPPA
jgi:SnoaL-like polyketide cyclase